MEASNARNPTAVHGRPCTDPMVTPDLRPHPPDNLPDSEKVGAALLVSGVFLSLVGITFTSMGWRNFQARPGFEWTQLLGPILISVGGTFILTSVFKFWMVSCWTCRHQEEEVFVIPMREQTPTGHPFVFRGISQPVLLHDTATVLCIPPAYNFITQEVHQANSAALPPYDAVYAADNAAFTAEDGGAEANRRSRTQKTEDERGDESGSTCSHPPAYEDIYPAFHDRSPT